MIVFLEVYILASKHRINRTRKEKMVIEQEREVESLTTQYPPEKTLELSEGIYSNREKKIYIDTLNELSGKKPEEIEDFELSPEQIIIFRVAVVPKDRYDLLWVIENSLYKLNQCPCPACEKRFTSTEEERKSSFCKDQAVLEYGEYPGNADLIRLHIHCKECRRG